MSIQFFEKTANGLVIQFVRETDEGWGGDAYSDFIKNHIREYSGDVATKVIDISEVRNTSSGDTIRNIINKQLNPNGSDWKSFQFPKAEKKNPYVQLKTKPAKAGKSNGEDQPINEIYNKIHSLDSATFFATIEGYSNGSSSKNRPKRNLFEDIQDDEVVVNIEELADLFAREILEIQGLRYENSLERYKFLVSKYSNFIKEVRKHES